MSTTAISDVKVYLTKGNEFVKANVTFTVGGVLSVRADVKTGKNGDFVSMPGSYKFKDKETGADKWGNNVKFTDRETGDAIQKLLLSEYNRVANGGKSAPATKTSSTPVPEDQIPF